jgi:hypothetical protein
LTVYTVSDNITGGAPCGTSAVSQVIGYPATANGPSTPTLTITSPNAVDRYRNPATDAAGNLYVYSASETQDCREVAGSEKILVFAPATSGAMMAAPIRTITGPATKLFGVGPMTVDGAGPGTEPFYMLRFAAGATGNAVPTAALLSVSGVGIATH